MVLADLDDEAHEVTRLLVEAERVQRPEAEGRVADPAVAVVPVALAARRLGQRGGGGGDDRAGRSVGEALEDQRRALQVDPPGMVGEVAVAQPGAPEFFGRVEPLECLRGAARPAQLLLAPGDGAEPGFVLAQFQGAADGAAVELQFHVAGQPQLGSVGGPRDRLAELAAAPGRRFEPVAEARQALHLHLDVAVDAGHRPQQRAVGLVCGLRPGSGPTGAGPVGDRQRVVDDDPAGVGDPGGLDHQRARLVAATDRDHHPLGPQTEMTGATIEQRRKSARRVKPRQAQPLDAAGKGDERRRVAVGQKAITADGGEVVF